MLGEHSAPAAPAGVRDAALPGARNGHRLGLLIDGKLFRGSTWRGGGNRRSLPIARHPTAPVPSTSGTFELEVGRRPSSSVTAVRRETGAITVLRIFELLERGDELAAFVLNPGRAAGGPAPVVTLQSLLDSGSSSFSEHRRASQAVKRVGRALPALSSRPITIAPSHSAMVRGSIGALCAAAQATRRIPE